MSPPRRRPEPKRLEPGAQLGPYRIVSSIGAGGMGEVFKARDDRLKRDVAIKCLPSAFAEDGDRLRRFGEEARAAGGLNHPGILAVYDLGEQDEVPYLVTELLEGQTLRERLAEGRLSPRKAIDLAIQIALALAAAHEKNIIHRDLKPENLFVLHDGRVKILDFGLAKAMAAETDGEPSPVDAGAATAVANTQTGAVVGTPGYMAPEQARGEAAIDARADIFAIGVVIYEMLAGQPAFPGDSPVERSFAVLKNDPAALPERTPPALDLLVRRCLEKKPAERFQSARDLAFSLQALSNVSTTAAVPVIGPAAGRRRWPLLAAAVAALVGIGAVGYAVGRRGTPVALAPSTPSYQKLVYRTGVITRARFTGDGRGVIFAADFDGEEPQVYEVAPGQGRPRSVSGAGVGLFDVSSTGDLALIVRRRVLARAPLTGGQPRELYENVTDAAWSRDGASLALARRSESRSKLEFPAGKVLRETDLAIEMVRVSPSGDRVAWVEKPVRREGRGRIWVAGGGQEARPLGAEWPSVDGVAWGPGGRELWVTAGDGDARRALRALRPDGSGERVLLRLPGVFKLEDVAADGRALLVWNDVHKRIVGFGAGQDPHELAWSNEDLLAGMTPDGGTVLLVDDASGMETKTFLRKSDGSPAVEVATGRGWAVSNDGRWVLLSPRPPWQELALVPTGPGDTQAQQTGTIAEVWGAAFASDGKRWVVGGRSAAGKPGLWLQQAGQAPAPLGGEGLTLSSPVSPDDSYVVARGAGGKLFRVPLDGGEATVLEGLEPYRTTVTGFSDDGAAAIVVRRLDDGGVALERYDFAAKKSAPVALDPSLATRSMTSASLSRDGKRGVLASNEVDGELFLVSGL